MEPHVAQLAEAFGRTIQADRVNSGIVTLPGRVFQAATLTARRFFLLRQIIKQAEEHLNAVSVQPGYAISVLKVISVYLLAAAALPAVRVLRLQLLCCCR